MRKCANENNVSMVKCKEKRNESKKRRMIEHINEKKSKKKEKE